MEEKLKKGLANNTIKTKKFYEYISYSISVSFIEKM